MRIFILISLVMLTASSAQASDEGSRLNDFERTDVYGTWRTESGDAFINIEDCGNGTPCGHLVWVDPRTSTDDRDLRNVDPDLRARKLIGIPIIWGYARSDGFWKNGRIYNPEYGETYKSSVRRRSNDTLIVKGCKGPFCITNTWTFVSDQTEGKDSSGHH